VEAVKETLCITFRIPRLQLQIACAVQHMLAITSVLVIFLPTCQPVNMDVQVKYSVNLCFGLESNHVS